MSYMRQHGGGCCGMRHIQSFSPVGEDKTFPTALSQVPPGRLAEVVLESTQCHTNGDMLAYYGFIPVATFVNDNTGNRLYVFYHHRAVTVTPLTSLPFSFSKEKYAEKLKTLPGAPIAQGEVVTVDSPRSKHHGKTGTVTSIFWGADFYTGRRWQMITIRSGSPFTSMEKVTLRATSFKRVK